MRPIHATSLAALALLSGWAAPLTAQQALRFDGGDDHVAIPHQSALTIADGGNLTIEFWMKPPSVGQWHILGKRGTCLDSCESCNYMVFGSAGLGLSFLSGACTTSATAVAADRWTHVAIVADSAGTRIYTNGNLAGEGLCTISGASTAPFWIGGVNDCANRFQGDLDDVRLWNVARSPAQIQQNLDQIIDPATPGLIGIWRFEEALDSQLVLDSTASGLHGTLGDNAQIAGDDPLRVASVVPFAVPIFADGFE